MRRYEINFEITDVFGIQEKRLENSVKVKHVDLRLNNKIVFFECLPSGVSSSPLSPTRIETFLQLLMKTPGPVGGQTFYFMGEVAGWFKR